jgi:Ca2+:H+ antiporter
VAGFLAHDRFGPVASFASAAAALSLLATVVGHGTEQLGSRLGPGATGVLQSALGNLPELFVCIFSLRQGLVSVVQGALVGSILANLLLVLGLALLTGGLRHGTQRFGADAPRMVATLMLLAVTALAIPTLADELHTPAATHEQALSAVCAVVLLVVFAASVPFSIRADPAVTPAPAAMAGHARGAAAQLNGAPGAPVAAAGDAHEAWPLPLAVFVLAAAATGAAFVSEWFVDALLPTTRQLGLSAAFTGLVVVAIAGNAVENVVAIRLAAKNKPDYAMSVVLNSSLQIALFLTPLLVLISFFIGPTPLTLVLPPLLVAALFLSSIVTAFIVYDGESIWLEGLALVGLYGIIVSSFWWG